MMTLSTGRRASARPRTPLIALVAAVVALLAPGVAHAEAPSNDDLGSATPVTALPFATTLDTAESTVDDDDPTSCYGYTRNTVWFDYTAERDGMVRFVASGTGFSPLISAYTGVRGDLDLVAGSCSYDSGTPRTFQVTAGTSYHLLVGAFYYGGPVSVRVEAARPAPNDDFASAQALTGPPAVVEGELGPTSVEPGEPVASCDRSADRSAWYTYTSPTTRSVALVATAFRQPSVAVYRGSALGGLSEVDCVPSRYTTAVFTAVAGETYRIRVAEEAASAGWFELRMTTASPLRPDPWFSPARPSVYDDVEVFPSSGDPLGRDLVGGEVRFGDGTSAAITGERVRHRYAADGTYTVEVTGTTSDGRTGTGSAELVVETHDVAVSAFTVPASAKVDQTGRLTVSVVNTRYAETVRVDLFKVVDGQPRQIGQLTQAVPARAGGKVDFPFAYTYGPADVGAVVFRAVAVIPDRYQDARPADNQATGTTTVRAKLAGVR